MNLKDDVELRKLPTGALYTITTVLETNNDWRTVMSFIPRNPRSDHFEPKYNTEHMKQIEDYAKASNKKCAEVLFEEWGSSGRIRPTLKTLQDVVEKAQIYRAADDIAELLGKPPPERPSHGPAALVPLNITEMCRIDMTTATVWKDKKSYEKNNDQPIGNRTTLRMKTDDRSITKTSSCINFPNLSAFQYLGDKAPTKTKSENDLKKYADELKEEYQSNFMPDFSYIMGNQTDSNQNSKGTDRDGDTEYQESFPKIEVKTEILNNSDLVHFPYKELETMTKKFSKTLVDVDPPHGKMAGKIGSGGFAEVYVGYHAKYGHVAVKKPILNRNYEDRPEIFKRVFNSEIQFLLLFKHKNIVDIIGYSKDGPSPCIVCEYIDGGTLEEKLKNKFGAIFIEKLRIHIMTGVAEALKYVHSDKTANITKAILDGTSIELEKNFVHGDVKTANILLTKEYVPKLCDFALGKQYDITKANSRSYYIGTPAYGAPEGFNGTITQEGDIYSYGIVLLELLTGKKSIVITKTGTMNLKMYMDENCQDNELRNHLDPHIDKWTKAEEIYALARKCLRTDRKERPTAADICDILNSLDKE